MNKPKLFLHIGIHKTGTTAIQAFAHKNRSSLLKQGFFYPDYRPVLRKQYEAHHDFAHTLAGKGKRLSREQMQHLTRLWADTAVNNKAITFLSSEAFCRHINNYTTGTWEDKRRTYLASLSHVLSPFSITVVVVIRRQDNYIKSLFQEHVMKNSPAGKLNFAEFRQRHKKNKVLHRFNRNLLMIEEFFPKIKVLVYEDLVNDGKLCGNFFSHLGVDVKGMKDVGIVRQSLSPRETVVKIFLNHGITTKKQNKAVLARMRAPEFQMLLDKYMDAHGYDLWENQQARNEFLANYADDNEQILQKYFVDRENLFPELGYDSKPKIPALTESCKAEIAVCALNQVSENYAGLAKKTKSVLQRIKKGIISKKQNRPTEDT